MKNKTNEKKLPVSEKTSFVDIRKSGSVDLNNETSKRKLNFCYYCDSFVQNFARHIIRNHSYNVEVQKMLAEPIGSRKRKQILNLLRKKGNFVSKKDEPVRKGAENTNYLPCIHCLGLYSTKNLWRHKKQCSENPNKGTSSAGVKSQSQNFLLGHLRIDSALRENVFPHMRADNISLVAKKDSLICSFGARYLKIHREKHFISVVSRKMREMAKLLIELKKLDPNITKLFDGLKPQYFDYLISATKTVAQYDTDKEVYVSPTYAMNIGTSLKQCCEIALMQVVKQKQHCSTTTAELEADIKTLIQLIQSQWKFEVSSQANNDLNVRKWNKITIVPLAADLKLLKDHLIKVANTAATQLNINNKNETAYIRLIETIFCRIILLNRRRPGELQRFLLHTYEQNIDKENLQTYDEFSEAVSETEKALMRNFKRIVVRGKRGRGVPVLFSKDIQEHLKLILKCRSGLMTKVNPYLFGNPKTTQPIIGYKVLRKYAVNCGAKNPDALTCTRLRKHLATLTQLFNLSENDMEQLASFMGHTLNIHRSSYRLPDDIYQTAKISKILLLMERGQAGEFKGKNLEDINVNLDEDLMCVEDENIEERIDDIESEINEVEVDENEEEVQKILLKKEVKTKSRKLVPWTENQKKVVLEYFKNHIKQKKPPKKEECENLIKKHPQLLHNKNWLKIKVFIQNKYTNKIK